MHMKIGELAKRSGLTVRTLHHYDSIGLLCPSARSEAGYRLYHRDDVARLHQIQALRRFGVALADIGTFLADPGHRLPAIVDQQIDALTRQIAQASALREQLTQLQRQLAAGEQPELASWLTTLELMNMYDKYFTKEQLARLPFFNGDQQRIEEWQAIVARMQALKDSGMPPGDPIARELARNWMIMLERDTGGDAQLLVGINTMQDNEPEQRARNGITPELGAYVMQAFSAFRLALYEKYLDADEFAFMKANYGKDGQAWPALIARVTAHMHSGAAPGDPASQVLAREWMARFCEYAGTNPATHAKIRLANQTEPGLLTGTFVTDELLAFIIAAMNSLGPRPA
jgi:MerR family transcriptional regulator, thiopeptide resistance regulator